MPISKIQLPDGRIAKFEVAEGTSEDEILEFANKHFAQAAPQKEFSDFEVGLNSLGKAVPGMVDSVLNAPNRIYNLAQTVGRELTDNPITSTQDPRLLPDLNLAGKAAELTGMARPEVAPSNKKQQALDMMIQGGVGAAVGGAGALAEGGLNAASKLFSQGAIAGLAADKTKEYTGSDTAALLAAALASHGMAEIPGAVGRVKQTVKDAARNTASQIEDKALNALNPAIDRYAPPVIEKAQSTANAASLPFNPEGQSEIVFNVLQRAAGGDPKKLAEVLSKWKMADEPIPGVIPTAAEVSQNEGIAALQRAVAQKNPEPYGYRQREQIASRLDAIDKLAGNDEAYNSAIAQRGESVAPLYQQFKAQMFDADQNFMSLMDRMPSEVKSKASEIAKMEGNRLQEGKFTPEKAILGPDGVPVITEPKFPQFSGDSIYYLDKALDQKLNTMKREGGIGSAEYRAVRKVKKDLNEWIDGKSELSLNAIDSIYQQASIPINKMDIARSLREKISPAISDHGALGRETAAKFANALRNSELTVRQATGMKYPIEDIMGVDGMNTLNGIAKSLAGKSDLETLGRGTGSNTYQNFAMDNILSTTGAPGLMKDIVRWTAGNSASGRILGSGMRHLYDEADNQIAQKIAEILLNPKTQGSEFLETHLKKRGVIPEGGDN